MDAFAYYNYCTLHMHVRELLLFVWALLTPAPSLVILKEEVGEKFLVLPLCRWAFVRENLGISCVVMTF